jgi:hypothetical protein
LYQCSNYSIEQPEKVDYVLEFYRMQGERQIFYDLFHEIKALKYKFDGELDKFDEELDLKKRFKYFGTEEIENNSSQFDDKASIDFSSLLKEYRKSAVYEIPEFNFEEHKNTASDKLKIKSEIISLFNSRYVIDPVKELSYILFKEGHSIIIDDTEIFNAIFATLKLNLSTIGIDEIEWPTINDTKYLIGTQMLFNLLKNICSDENTKEHISKWIKETEGLRDLLIKVLNAKEFYLKACHNSVEYLLNI